VVFLSAALEAGWTQQTWACSLPMQAGAQHPDICWAEKSAVITSAVLLVREDALCWADSLNAWGLGFFTWGGRRKEFCFGSS